MRVCLSISEHPRDQSYQNIPKSKEAAADTERVDEGGQSYQNIPRPRPKSAAAPQPAKRLSLHGPPKVCSLYVILT